MQNGKTGKKLEELRPGIEKAVGWKAERTMRYRYMAELGDTASNGDAMQLEAQWKAYLATEEAQAVRERLCRQLLNGDERTLLIILEQYDAAMFDEKLPPHAKGARGYG